MSNSNLNILRQYRQWEQQIVANELSISLEKYQLLEVGAEKVSEEIALKLSDLYRLPPELFLDKEPGTHISFIYTHNTFNNSNGFVHNLYQNSESAIAIVTAVKDEEIKILKQQIDQLREQNINLIQLLGKIKK